MTSKQVLELFDEFLQTLSPADAAAVDKTGGVDECYLWVKTTKGADVADAWFKRISDPRGL